MEERDAPLTIDPYSQIAELYDLEHDDYDEDIELYLGLLQTVDGPVLEMGSGSGRLLLPIAGTGHAITGLDSSPRMLDRAAKRIAVETNGSAITLHQADMQDAADAPGGPFGLVIFSLNALMHLETAVDQRSALKAARQSLRPGGYVIIDTMNPSLEQLQHLVSRSHLEGTWTLDNGAVVDKWSHRENFSADQILDTVIWYDTVQPDGAMTRTRTQFPLRYVHPNELEMMLDLAGFVSWNVYGSYDLGPLSDESDRLIVIAGNSDES
ncbi:MAG: class I SAM-dependent methyltransferase [Thermomicrobiales bacterium]